MNVNLGLKTSNASICVSKRKVEATEVALTAAVPQHKIVRGVALDCQEGMQMVHKKRLHIRTVDDSSRQLSFFYIDLLARDL